MRVLRLSGFAAVGMDEEGNAYADHIENQHWAWRRGTCRMGQAVGQMIAEIRKMMRMA